MEVLNILKSYNGDADTGYKIDKINLGNAVLVNKGTAEPPFKTAPDSNGVYYVYNESNSGSYIKVDRVKHQLTYTYDTDGNITGIASDTPVDTNTLYVCKDGSTDADVAKITIYSINDKAFYDKTSLTDIDLPDNIYRIGNSAFEKCVNLLLQWNFDTFVYTRRQSLKSTL